LKPYVKWAAIAMIATSGVAVAQAVPNDVPPGHWAYQAIEDLANKGLILGYPDGRFLGNRSLTRYEMAALTQRLLRKIEEDMDARDQALSTKIAESQANANPPAEANPAPSVTPEELDEVRKLTDEFKVELSVMGTDMEKVKSEIAELQQMKDEVDSLSATVGGIGEKVNSIDQDVADLKKGVKISGYIQSRYTSAGGSYKPGAKPEDNFSIRRGRLKFTYTGDKSDYILQFDGSAQGGMTIKDAIAVWKLSPLYKDRQPTQIWFGQFNTPFGYEIEWSDADSFFLERSLAEGALFPGERDRGVRAVTNLGPKAWIDASILNGGGINAPFADDNFKDFTARIKGTPAPWWHLGVSGLWGKTQVPGVAGTPATPGALVYDKDTNGDGVIDQTDSPSFSPGKAAAPAIPGFDADRKRFGVDTQMNVLGGTLFGEGYWGRQPNTLADPDVKVFGWYGAFARNVTPSDLLAVRYDSYDPNRDANDDVSSRWTAVWHHIVSKNFKLSGQYEWFPQNAKGTLDTPRWTIQAQTKF
jgi:hypothetical protein